MLMNCQMWTTLSQTRTLLKVNQRQRSDWDTCPEHTELLKIGCLTALIFWTSKCTSSMWTPRTNSRTCWQRVASRVMNGTIFFVVQHHEFPDVFLQPISSEQEAEAPCRRELRTGESKLAVAKAEVSMFLFGVKKPIERETHLISRFGYFTQPRVQSWDGVLFQGARRNLCETGSRTRQLTLKSGKEMTIRFGVRWNPCGVVCVSVQGARWNPCEVLRTNLQGQGWTTTRCTSQTINTFQKSSRMIDRSWIVLKMLKMMDQTANVLIWKLLVSAMKASVHLGPNYNENLVA